MEETDVVLSERGVEVETADLAICFGTSWDTEAQRGFHCLVFRHRGAGSHQVCKRLRSERTAQRDQDTVILLLLLIAEPRRSHCLEACIGISKNFCGASMLPSLNLDGLILPQRRQRGEMLQCVPHANLEMKLTGQVEYL
jgi:hypothetical protein